MKVTEYEKMKNRVRQMVFEFNSEVENLRLEKRSYGWSVEYIDWFGDSQIIDIMEFDGKRKSHVVRWTTNGNLKLRLPKYDRHFIG
ncbi:hypothetical protein [uncultured Treponema sp.]|jgi:hypothetical protein|uniref:hypothetical protein n=1 Tax=uncultured Treponema sp. TaxID=162155 RepID=UPI00280B946F|nr:hypothetical protein [uncultured Treponema sp.]